MTHHQHGNHFTRKQLHKALRALPRDADVVHMGGAVAGRQLAIEHEQQHLIGGGGKRTDRLQDVEGGVVESQGPDQGAGLLGMEIQMRHHLAGIMGIRRKAEAVAADRSHGLLEKIAARFIAKVVGDRAQGVDEA